MEWVKGRGLAGFCYNAVFRDCQETAKALQSHCKENCKAFKRYSLNVFLCFLFFVLQFCSDREMYRNAVLLACKNHANGVGVGRVGGFLQCTAKLQKILASAWFSTVWRFAVSFAVALQWLCSSFAVSEKRLIFNALLTSSKCLIFNGFKHTQGSGRGVLYGAKQGCKARMPSKQASKG